jgi:DNA-binding NarL/FixJ family response regulator
VQALSSPVSALDRAAHAAVTLSAREHEVLRLLAAGNADREIAEALYLSVRTVERHVSRIFAKLGVRTRAAAVSAAMATGLVERALRAED